MSTVDFRRVMYVIAYPLAVAMIVFWAIMTFVESGPGWAHLFLSLGVFTLIWRVAAGGTEQSWRKYVAERDRRQR